MTFPLQIGQTLPIDFSHSKQMQICPHGTKTVLMGRPMHTLHSSSSLLITGLCSALGSSLSITGLCAVLGEIALPKAS